MYDKRLDTFLLVAECGSFSKAASLSFITPAAVMKQINSLEREVDVPLFSRTTTGVKLTEAGITFRREAKGIIDYSNGALERTRHAAQLDIHTIHVGSSLLQPHRHLMELWSVIRAYSQLRFELEIVPFDDDRKSIRSMLSHLGGRIDVIGAACDSNYWLDSCQFFPIEYVPICCAIPISNSLSNESELEIDNLHGEQVMVIPQGASSSIDAVRAEFIEHHPQISIVDGPASYDMETFNYCERNGIIMLAYPHWEDAHPFMKMVPVNWDFKSPYGLLYPIKMSESVYRFLSVFELARRKGALPSF